jgi:hypothetical protein
VIVDDATMHATDGAIAYEPHESVEAKGKSEPISAWRASEARSRVGQPEAATHTPFVGRERERTLLLRRSCAPSVSRRCSSSPSWASPGSGRVG